MFDIHMKERGQMPPSNQTFTLIMLQSQTQLLIRII
jgi:hypothetical protein